MNASTTELVVTAPLDREESERYRLLLVCTVRTETLITKMETSLDIFVNDEDDNGPYVNGTDTADVTISFNRTKVRRAARYWFRRRLGIQRLTFPVLRFQGGTFGTLSVFDRDLTPIYPIDQSHNKYVGMLRSNDQWVKETFDIKGTFSETTAAHGGIRETVHDYRKKPKGCQNQPAAVWKIPVNVSFTFTSFI